jgi:hypothetical protein
MRHGIATLTMPNSANFSSTLQRRPDKVYAVGVNLSSPRKKLSYTWIFERIQMSPRGGS